MREKATAINLGNDEYDLGALTPEELAEIKRRVDNAILSSEKGVANGVASLDAHGLVSISQMPFVVDKIAEYPSINDFPQQGDANTIYLAKDTQQRYRWGGTQYVPMSEGLALGETSATAYPGDKGKKNAEDINKLQSQIRQAVFLGDIVGEDEDFDYSDLG